MHIIYYLFVAEPFRDPTNQKDKEITLGDSRSGRVLLIESSSFKASSWRQACFASLNS